MMYSMKRLTTIITAIAILSTFVTTGIAFAQPPPPQNPDDPWYPSGGAQPLEEPLVGSGGGTPPPPGAQATIVSAFMQDQLGNGRTEFYGNEQFYLNISLSIVPGSTQTILDIAEYFPQTSTLQAHWLVFGWLVPNSANFRLGPFYAQPLEPEGTHTWKIWLTDLNTGHQSHYLARFNYFAEKPEPEPEPEPEVPAEPEEPEEPPPPQDISTSISVTLSTMSPEIGEAVTVFAVVNPANAGNVSVEQSTDGINWMQIGSGTASGTVMSQFSPPDAGTYYIRARATEYMDQSANERFLASESSPVILEVHAKGVNTLALGLGIGLGSLAGVLVWLVRRRRATTSS